MSKCLSFRTLFACLSMLVLTLIYSTQTILQAQSVQPEAGTWDIAWSPDGTRLATANPGGVIYIWDRSGELLRTLSGHAGRAVTVAWSSDGSLLASGGWDSFIRVWNVETGELTHEIDAFPEGVYVLAWQPNGNQLLAGGFDKFQAWDTSTWTPITDVVSVTILDLSWSPDGTRFAYASTPDNVGVATIEEGEVRATNFEGHTLFPYSVTWGLDGEKLISGGGRDGSVRLWDAETGEQLSILLQTDEIVTDAIFISDNASQVASVTEEGNIYILNAENGEVETILTTDAHLSALAWNPVTDMLALSGLIESPQESLQATANNDATGFLEIIPLAELQ